MEVTLNNAMERRFEPGDLIEFLVTLYHKCDSSADATDVDVVVFLPGYVPDLQLNDVQYTGTLPEYDTRPGADYVNLKVGRWILEICWWKILYKITAELK